jgi:type III secretion protein J
MKLRCVILVSILLLTGCKVDLYSNLSEQDANQMLALLLSNNIAAEKQKDSSGNVALFVEKNHFVNAVEILRQNGFPRKQFQSAEDIFPSGQLVTSPAQENTKIIYLKEQALERMFNNIEGVTSASVTIAMGVQQGAGFEKKEKPSASVLIRHSPDMNLSDFSIQIRDLILNAIPGINERDISLVLQPTIYRLAVKDNPVLTQRPASSHVVSADQAEVAVSSDKSAEPALMADAVEHANSSATKVINAVKSNPASKWGLYVIICWLVGMALILLHARRGNIRVLLKTKVKNAKR